MDKLQYTLQYRRNFKLGARAKTIFKGEKDDKKVWEPERKNIVQAVIRLRRRQNREIRVVFSKAEMKRMKLRWLKEEAIIMSKNIRLQRSEAYV